MYWTNFLPGMLRQLWKERQSTLRISATRKLCGGIGIVTFARAGAAAQQNGKAMMRISPMLEIIGCGKMDHGMHTCKSPTDIWPFLSSKTSQRLGTRLGGLSEGRVSKVTSCRTL